MTQYFNIRSKDIKVICQVAIDSLKCVVLICLVTQSVNQHRSMGHTLE